MSSWYIIILIFSLLDIGNGILKSFVKILGDESKPKHRQRNLYKFPDQWKRTIFLEFSLNEIEMWAPFNSS